MIPLALPANLGKTLATGSAPDTLALVDLSDPARPRRWSYGEIDVLADAVAGGLRSAGIAPGERVGLVCSNSARAVAVLLGSMRAGCIAVPVNPRAGAEVLRFMCDDAAMAIVFADAAGLNGVPASRQFVRLEDPLFESFLYPASFVAFQPQPDDAALVLYTSGSTGRPKGVLLSHRSQLLIAAGYATPFMSECLASGPAIVAAPSEQEVKQFVIDHAAPYLHPRRVWFIDHMPLGGTNKIDRKALQARAAELAQLEAVGA
ncbi:MAG: AMP-binding protein [Betaproteobacteria bacterium]